jgi:hypothetical protein
MLSDAATRLLLQDRDYVPLAMPTTDLRLLDVLTRTGPVLHRYSRLEQVLMIDPAAPELEVRAGEPVVATGGSNHRAAKLGIGLAAVSQLLQAFGGKADLSITADKAREVRYDYSDVTADRVDLGSLDGWLAHADLRPGVRRAADLLTAQQLYVVVATLKAGSLEVEFLNEGSAGVEVEVAAVQDVIGGNVSVSSESKRSSRLLFAGPAPLTVAAKAAQLRIDDHGIWVNERFAKLGEVRSLGDARTFLHDDALHLD